MIGRKHTKENDEDSTKLKQDDETNDEKVRKPASHGSLPRAGEQE